MIRVNFTVRMYFSTSPLKPQAMALTMTGAKIMPRAVSTPRITRSRAKIAFASLRASSLVLVVSVSVKTGMNAADMEPSAKSSRRPLPSTLRFRRQSFWQIIFPVIVVALLALGAVVALYLVTGKTGTSVVADFSLILVILPACLLVVVFLVINVALIVLLRLMITRIPRYTNAAQRKMQGTHVGVDSFANKLTSGVLSALAVLRVMGSVVDRWSANGDQPTPDK